jgi:quercetin dioxygenase-like cupin family protein
MKRAALLVSSSLVVGIALGVIGTGVVTAQFEQVKRTVLLTADLAGIAGKRATVWRGEFAPGASGSKHRHPVDTFVYVLDGTLTLKEEGKGPRTLTAGEVVQEVPTGIYSATNTSMTRSTTILVVSLGEKDQPFAVPVK